jgi:uncharacterized phage protein gp47/JayE
VPFPRQTLTALRTQAMQDITASDLPNADGFMRRSALRVLAWVQAGMAFLHYGYLDWIALQATPFTSTGEFLEAWAALAPIPVIRKAPVQAACPNVTFVAVTGSPIPAGTLMYRADATQYSTQANVTAASGSATVAIKAVVAGASGDADAGTTLTLASGVSGVTAASGVAVSPITGGADLETDQSLRSRMLESYANPPSGGSAADYLTWALQVPGVTRAWADRDGMGGGTVVLYFMMDATEAAHSGFPQGTTGVASVETRDTVATGDQLIVANWVWPLQPVTALVYAAAPSRQAVNFTVAGLAGTTAAQQNAVVAAINAQFVALGNPAGTATIQQSDIESAITAIAGLPSFNLQTPTVWPIPALTGSLPTVGSVTFV